MSVTVSDARRRLTSSSLSVSRLWLVLAAVSGLLLACALTLHTAVAAERAAVSREAEYTRLGYELSRASDYLTDAVRKFVVTADPVHLRNYWYEIDTTRSREQVLLRLSELQAPSNELDLLEQAKRQSDMLVATEIRGMRLMLSVMDVPETAMPPAVGRFRLVAADVRLTPAEKVRLAQTIMFDAAYSAAKRSIMDPIDEFQRIMSQRVARETAAAQRWTRLVLAATIVGSALATLLVLLVVWRRLLDIREEQRPPLGGPAPESLRSP